MIRIIVDSTSDFTTEQAKANNIIMLPLKVRFGNEEYLDKINITNDEFYEKLMRSNELPKTALVGVGEFLDEFEKYPDDDLIVITLSSKFSGTYQAAYSAKEISERKNVFVVDSGSASLGFALLVDKAMELIKSNSAFETAKMLNSYAKRIRIVGVIDTLKYLVKGGRLSPLQGAAGSLLNIKPLLLIKHGQIESIGKARGTKAALIKLDEIVKSKFKVDRTEEIIFGYAYSDSAIEDVKKIMGHPKHSRTVSIGSVVGTHTGPSVVCVAFFEHKIIGSKI